MIGEMVYAFLSASRGVENINERFEDFLDVVVFGGYEEVPGYTGHGFIKSDCWDGQNVVLTLVLEDNAAPCYREKFLQIVQSCKTCEWFDSVAWKVAVQESSST